MESILLLGALAVLAVPVLLVVVLVAVGNLKRRVAELEHNLAARDKEISRLETGAVTACDTTEPNQEHRIDELADHNTQLQRELAAMSDRLDGQLGEAEALRRALQERDRRLAENEGRAS